MQAETSEWLNQRVYDKKYFTARYVDFLGEKTGMQPDVVAKGFVGGVVCVLAVNHEAHVLANGLLVLAPLLMTFVHADEKPADKNLHVYWTLFGLSVLVDRVLEKIPLYYIAKLVVFFLLALPPYNLINRAEELLTSMRGEGVKNEAKTTSMRGNSSRKNATESTAQRSTQTKPPPASFGSGGRTTAVVVDASTDADPPPTETASAVTTPPTTTDDTVTVTRTETYFKEEAIISPSGARRTKRSGPFTRTVVYYEHERIK